MAVSTSPTNIHKKTNSEKQEYYIELLVEFLSEPSSPVGEILRVLIRRLRMSTPTKPYSSYETEILLIVSLAEHRARKKKAR